MQAYLSDIAKKDDFGAETCSRVIPKTVQKKRSPTFLVGYSESDIGADRLPALSVVQLLRRDPAARRPPWGPEEAGWKVLDGAPLTTLLAASGGYHPPEACPPGEGLDSLWLLLPDMAPDQALENGERAG